MKGDTQNFTDQKPSDHIEVKAQLLAKVLEKHKPEEIKAHAFKLMQNLDKGSDAYKVAAAAYEVFDILK